MKQVTESRKVWKRKVKTLQIAMWLGVLMVAETSSATLLLSEVLYDATGTDNGSVFVELFGDPGTVLDGFSLVGINGANGAAGTPVWLTGTIPASGFFVVADDSGDGTSFVLGANLVLNFDFQNGPDSIQLWDSSNLIDAVGYGVFGIGETFAGEGNAVLDVTAGSSLARYFSDVDTNDNAADFGELTTPTPGTGLLAVPEPGTLTLLGLGVLGMSVFSSPQRRGVGSRRKGSWLRRRQCGR